MSVETTGEKALTTHSYETYLQLEAESGLKHEFHDGFIVAMAGGSGNHSQLGTNVGRFLGNALDKAGKNCNVFNSDLKVRIAATNRVYYPDASVVCEPPVFSEKDKNALTNPSLIVEVLSDSTEAFDRGDKFFHYRQIPSLQEYVLINQNEIRVETFYRHEGNLWEINSVEGLEAELSLKSLGVVITLSDLYRMVEIGE
ncbi:MAG: Uma2 family endonuclease [Bacteroidia bacterium]|nr:Uma2 family endonuclease [Bacteroidia bacterium]